MGSHNLQFISILIWCQSLRLRHCFCTNYMVVRTALACFSRRRRRPVLQVMEYLTHATCLPTGASVHFMYKPFTYYRRLSCSDGLQGKKKTHPPTALGGVAKSNIQTGVGVVRLPSSLLPFPLCTLYPHWLIAIGVCPFALVPTYLLYVLFVLVLCS